MNIAKERFTRVLNLLEDRWEEFSVLVDWKLPLIGRSDLSPVYEGALVLPIDPQILELLPLSALALLIAILYTLLLEPIVLLV